MSVEFSKLENIRTLRAQARDCTMETLVLIRDNLDSIIKERKHETDAAGE
ncbi:hypothetical protein [Streptomyces sp. 147326]